MILMSCYLADLLADLLALRPILTRALAILAPANWRNVGMKGRRDRVASWGTFCVACEFFHLDPASKRVDQAGKSRDEADALCIVHRARMTEGLCVLCGRRLPWVSPWTNSSIGCCETCFRVMYGNDDADQIQVRLSRKRKRAS